MAMPGLRPFGADQVADDRTSADQVDEVTRTGRRAPPSALEMHRAMMARMNPIDGDDEQHDPVDDDAETHAGASRPRVPHWLATAAGRRPAAGARAPRQRAPGSRGPARADTTSRPTPATNLVPAKCRSRRCPLCARSNRRQTSEQRRARAGLSSRDRSPRRRATRLLLAATASGIAAVGATVVRATGDDADEIRRTSAQDRLGPVDGCRTPSGDRSNRPEASDAQEHEGRNQADRRAGGAGPGAAHPGLRGREPTTQHREHDPAGRAAGQHGRGQRGRGPPAPA